ncbi:zinc finger BED domain-containing protein 6-like [Topomyia yanbarensis]|uniref:zinc finger BED domain-containing protein 6-like n=1 Tax=Topomyia yanbarensis TaxID=2498891 RepID=UPI00273C371B|nr:zinc finger BED domain-containing protein 6-like [Topomyia yanbarensis]
MSTRGRITSGIWYHFSKEGTKAKCRYCYTIISSSNGFTGNMKRHLKSKHPMVSYDRNATESVGADLAGSEKESGGNESTPKHDMPLNADSRDDGKGVSDSGVADNGTIVVSSCTVPKISSHSSKTPLMTRYVDVHRPVPIAKSRSLDSQLLKMICKEYHPFSLVEDAEFKEFVRMLCPMYVLPSRKTLTNSLLPTLYNEALAKVKQELEEASAVSWTSDGWTNINNISFYALTAHFIDQRGSLKSYLLECSEFDDKHTGENIASWITKVLQSFNIDFKITAIVTDNASNMKSAASILNLSIYVKPLFMQKSPLSH